VLPCLLTPGAGDINRQALGDLVFSDAAARRRLNAATHLPVAAGILRQLAWAWLCCRLVVVSRDGNSILQYSNLYCVYAVC
jgi:hypothetical protein